MGFETQEWREKNFMMGYTDDKSKWEGNSYAYDGKAWWMTSDGVAQGRYMTYPGPIPVDDIRTKLFHFEIATAPLWFPVPCELSDPNLTGMYDDGSGYRLVQDETFQVVYHGDTLEVFTVASADGYVVDQYEKTILTTLSNLLSVSAGELGIGSAQLLCGGAAAAVTVELPECVVTPEGFAFRPKMMVVDSYNQRFKYGIYYTKQIPVCENGVMAFTSSSALSYTRKHTSPFNLGEARRALKIMHEDTDKFKAEVAALAQWEVTDAEFRQTVNALVPIPDPVIGPKGNVQNQAAITRRDNKQQKLYSMWASDPRCSDWRGTALGAWQTWNTFNTHETSLRGSTNEEGLRIAPVRDEKVTVNLINGKTLERDEEFLNTLADVCDMELAFSR